MAITSSRYTLGMDREVLGQKAADTSRSRFLRQAFRGLKRRGDYGGALKMMDEMDAMGRPMGQQQTYDGNMNSAAGVVSGREQMANLLRRNLQPPVAPKPGAPVTSPPAPSAPKLLTSPVPPGESPVPPAGDKPADMPTQNKTRMIDGMPAAEWMKKFGGKPSPIQEQVGPGRPMYADPKNLTPEQMTEQERMESLRPVYGPDGKLTTKAKLGEGDRMPRFLVPSKAVPVADDAPAPPAPATGARAMSWDALSKQAGRAIKVPTAGSYRTRSAKELLRTPARTVVPQDSVAARMQRWYDRAGRPTISPRR